MEAERLYILANHLNEEGNYGEAIKLYDRALELFPEYTEVIHDKSRTIAELS